MEASGGQNVQECVQQADELELVLPRSSLGSCISFVLYISREVVAQLFSCCTLVILAS